MNMNLGRAILLTTFLMLHSPLSHADDANAWSPGSWSPESWGQSELLKYELMEASTEGGNPVAVGSNGLIAGVYSGAAVRAGLEVLQRGGSAADAALATAITQVTLAAGSWVSYSGILVALYYDAETGQVHNLNAGYNTVLNETDPLSIPVGVEFPDFFKGTPSGRATLVPGMMAGVQALHDRFGSVPFATLFEPAIYFAENGFTVNGKLAGAIRDRAHSLTRLPETRALFTRGDGEIYQEGDRFRQPELAHTLREISRHGADYMYTGPWAEKLVTAVQAEGGKLSLEDLARYRAQWVEPSRTEIQGQEIYGSGWPSHAGVSGVQAMNLMNAAGLTSGPHYSEDPESFFWLSQILRVDAPTLQSEPELAAAFPEIEWSVTAATKKETAEAIWKKIRAGEFPLTRVPPGPKNTDAIVAVDRMGNVVSLIHTSNTALWGATGLFVDGISITDSGGFQQSAISAAGPGNRLPDTENPMMVLKQGKPVFAVASKGVGHHYQTIQTLSNLMFHGMDARSAVNAPAIYTPQQWPLGTDIQRVAANAFDPGFLESLSAWNLEISEVPPANSLFSSGLSVALQIDAERGLYIGGSPALTNGQALAW